MTVIEELPEFRGIDRAAVPRHAYRICGVGLLRIVAAERQCQKVGGFRSAKASSVAFAAAPPRPCKDESVQIERHVSLSVGLCVGAPRGGGRTR